MRQQKRTVGGNKKVAVVLQARDIDDDFDRGSSAAANLSMLFQDVIGGDAIVQKLDGYQRVAANMQARDMDPREQLPFTFVFRRPPGSGSTTTARKIGKVYYDMGFLASDEVVECSATDLIGRYVGQTGPKTQAVFNKALGKVLFIDEAYRLAGGQSSGGRFAQEAMDEIVDCLTKLKYARKMLVILAGHDKDMNRLMSTNPGLTSRFPETINFPNLHPDACITLLAKLMEKQDKILDSCVLQDPHLNDFSNNFRKELETRFMTLSQIDTWANARDVQTIHKAIFVRLMTTAEPSTAFMIVSEQLVLSEMDAMIWERAKRAGTTNVCKASTEASLL